MPPHYPLENVKKLVEEDIEYPERGKVIFSAKPKSIDSVIKTFSGLGRRLTSVKANEYIKYRLLELKECDFYQTETGQWGDPTFITDQYGMRHDGIPWFIKFRIDPDTGELDEISFHPLERDMSLANGTVLNKTWSSP